MTFDDKISENVSLSKVLDCLILDGESPSVILNFLKQYDANDIVDILKHSSRFSRMFSIDFMSTMSNGDLMSFVDIVRIVYERCKCPIATRFIWRVVQSNLRSEFKNAFKGLLSEIPKYVRHPYRGKIGTEMSKLEMIFKDVNRPLENIIKFFNSIPLKTFEWYVSHLDSSLFFERMVEDDFFNELIFERQYIFISNISYCTKLLGRCPVEQLMNSSIDVNLKKVLYDSVRNYTWWSQIGDNTWLPAREYDDEKEDFITETIKNSDSYAEMMINLTLVGMEDYAKDIILLLLFDKPDYLMQMYEDSPEIIRDNYDICDLIEFLKKEK